MKKTLILISLLALTPALSGCGIVPAYNVYEKRMDGKAKLAEADSSRQIAVLEAKAKFESAGYEAEAEIRRAQGAAKSIEITGAALQQNPEYLRYLYVNNLANSKDQIIYIPTEAGLPILEAGRRPPTRTVQP